MERSHSSAAASLGHVHALRHRSFQRETRVIFIILLFSVLIDFVCPRNTPPGRIVLAEMCTQFDRGLMSEASIAIRCLCRAGQCWVVEGSGGELQWLSRGDLALIKAFDANQKQAGFLDLGQSGIGHLNTIHQRGDSVLQCGGAPVPHGDGSGGLLSCT